MYKTYKPVASKSRVVPVSTMPAVAVNMTVVPYLTDRLMPQNCEDGSVDVTGLEQSHVRRRNNLTATTHVNVIGAMNLLGSVPPKVSSPFNEVTSVAGSKEMDTRSAGMSPWLKALSTTA